GGDGNDFLIGSYGIDTVLGGGGKDTIYGGFFPDVPEPYLGHQYPRGDEAAEMAVTRLVRINNNLDVTGDDIENPMDDPSNYVTIIQGDIVDGEEGSDLVFGTEGADVYQWKAGTLALETISDPGTGTYKDSLIVEGIPSTDGWLLGTGTFQGEDYSRVTASKEGTVIGTIQFRGIEQLTVRTEDVASEFRVDPAAADLLANSGLTLVNVELPSFAREVDYDIIDNDDDGIPEDVITQFGPPPLRNGTQVVEIYLSSGGDEIRVQGLSDVDQNVTSITGSTPIQYLVFNSKFESDSLFVHAGAGDDTVIIEPEASRNIFTVVDGGANDDILQIVGGKETSVQIFGGPGNDTLIAGPGTHVVAGETGSDTYQIPVAPDSIDIEIRDTSPNPVDIDTLDLSAHSGYVNVDLSNIGGKQTVATNVNVTIFGFLENVIGGSGRNDLTGNDRNNVLIGGDDRDNLFGLGGNDVLIGGGANDFLYGGDGDDELDGGSGNDELYGDIGEDTLFGGDGIDRLFGGDNDDQLYGGRGSDEMFGEGGNDLLYDGRGDDLFNGGAGNDLYQFIFDSTPSTSTLWLQDLDDLDFSTAIENLTLDLSVFSVQEVIPNHFILLVDQGGAVRNVMGSSGRNTIFGNDEDNRIVGGDLPDLLVGNGGNDHLISLGGNDTVYGGDGHDTIETGSGNDDAYGGDGIDFLVDGIGKDWLVGNAGDDWFLLNESNAFSETTVTGGSEMDTISLGNHFPGSGYTSDVVLDLKKLYVTVNITPFSPIQHRLVMMDQIEGATGGSGNDHLIGNDLDNYLDGWLGSDSVDGYWGDDTVVGGQGNDELLGGTGNDQIFGGTGNDTLIGGIGNDTQYGGDGDDTLGVGQDVDVAEGGDGSDTYLFQFDYYPSRTTISDISFNEIDTLDFSSATFDLTVDLGVLNTEQLIGQIYAGSALTPYPFGAKHHLVLRNNLDNAIGGRGNDRLLGNAIANVLSGGGGGDLLYGRNGNDTLIGGNGLDFLFGGLDNDTLDGGFDRQADRLDGGPGIDLGVQYTVNNSAEDIFVSGIENVSTTTHTVYDDVIAWDANTGRWKLGISNGTQFSEVDGPEWDPSQGWDVFTGDFNGDGRTDLAGRDHNGYWHVALNQGNSFHKQQWGRWSTSHNWENVQVGDFNGDGQDDIIGQNSYGEWCVALSGGTYFRNEWFGKWSPTGWGTILVGDVDGDAKDDLIGFDSATGRWWVGISDGAEFATKSFLRWSNTAGWRNFFVGDFNGDNRVDVLAQQATGHWFLGYSEGDRFRSQYANRWDPQAFSSYHIGDFNGDGRDDFAGRHLGGAWWINHSLANGRMSGVYAGRWSATLEFTTVTGDFNGDGRIDIAGIISTPGGWYTGSWLVLKNNGSQYSNQVFGKWTTHLTPDDLFSGDIW
ncbi:MAG: VCBS repeat-containing protein, partial [Planctomycetaceae bacterium]|nr:VCBS repeat-containing protein [Planctomycetaceae bacterium]